MNLPRPLRFALAALTLLAALHGARAQTPAPVFIPTSENIADLVTEKGPRLSLDTSGALRVEFPGGNDYPGVNFPVPAAGLDHSAHAGLEIELTNLGPARLNLNLRVDNPGDWRKSPWNTENVWIGAGETKTLKLTFGRSYGRAGFALDPARITAIKFFAAQPKETSTVLVKALRPFGTGASATQAAPAVRTLASPSPTAGGTVLFDPAAVSDTSRFLTGEGTQVSLARDASGSPVIEAVFPAMSGYPSFDFPKSGAFWDLSGFAGIQVEVFNSGAHPVVFALRADNAGDWRKQPWNVEQVRIAPGETKTLKVTFGRSFNNPGYALDASKITVIKIYAANPTKGATLQIKKLSAFGSPSATPSSAGSAQGASPVAAGQDATYSPSITGELIDLAKPQPLAGFHYSDSSASVEDGKLKVVFSAGANYPNIQFPIPRGGWNLSAFDRVEVEITNPGPKTVTPHLRVDNPGHWKDEPWNTQRLGIGPGETKTLTLVFGQDNGAPGFPLNPARVSGIQLFLVKPKQDTPLIISGVKAAGSPADAANRLSFTKPEDRHIPVHPPVWLGQRPPVEGDWVKTLDENFDGYALNTDRWNTRFPWDGPQPGQLQRYSPDNVEVVDGILTLLVEKKTGHENNDPRLPARDYTSGLVTTFDKWSQRYGYFEARIKIPYTRGLWPAFWMMPDRGRDSGLSMWQRRDTGAGAMEIDIMEILSEWGPGRNSVAVHWDGYGEEHKQWGTSQIYFGPTPDGWHAFGLLWEPGKLTWFVDGKKTAELVSERVSNVPSYLKLNVQLGGWATKDVDDANLPAAMQVDYVRAWQLRGTR
jgi:Beta-glucanase/Beta-glucan synthetase